jgi:hypothetical protein
MTVFFVDHLCLRRVPELGRVCNVAGPGQTAERQGSYLGFESASVVDRVDSPQTSRPTTLVGHSDEDLQLLQPRAELRCCVPTRNGSASAGWLWV